MSQPPQRFSPAFLDHFDTFIFDCDGVVWLDYNVLPGVQRTIRILQRAGKRVVFCTNNSTQSRQQFVQIFSKVGIPGVTKVCVMFFFRFVHDSRSLSIFTGKCAVVCFRCRGHARFSPRIRQAQAESPRRWCVRIALDRFALMHAQARKASCSNWYHLTNCNCKALCWCWFQAELGIRAVEAHQVCFSQCFQKRY